MTNTATKRANEQITITVKEENNQLVLYITDGCSWSENYLILNPFTIKRILPTRADSVYEKLFIEIIGEDCEFLINTSYKGNSFENIPIYKGLKLELS
ncbi:hypothetical protein [Bartonella sp. DGB1]|uniref:hypothetical protein n=1 Tax=Bartonella sp. DGB1 TaxID=3239807 RepID=UPI003524959C